MMQNRENTGTLPSVWATIAAGFELTTRHPWILLIPVVLDLFLWLGPRLSFEPLVADLIAQWATQPGLPFDPVPVFEQIGPRTNLFTYLSVALVGVPALLVGLTPEQTPLATTAVEIGDWGTWIGLLAVMTVAGLFLSAVYYTLIAHAMNREERYGGDGQLQAASSLAELLGWIGRSWLRLLGLALLFIGLTLLIVLPVTLVGTLVGLFSQLLAALVLLALPVLLLWLILLLSYTPEGVVLSRKPLLPTIFNSVRLFQRNFLAALLLVLVVLLISQVMTWLLLAADDGSWFTLAGILAHAFVATALSAAMLIFYRDRYRFMMLEERSAE